MNKRSRLLPKGLPGAASGGLVGYQTIDWDTDGIYAELDGNLAAHCDAAVNALPPAQQCVVYHRYGLTAVYHFPRNNYDALLEEARRAIRRTLERRGVVVT